MPKKKFVVLKRHFLKYFEEQKHFTVGIIRYDLMDKICQKMAINFEKSCTKLFEIQTLPWVSEPSYVDDTKVPASASNDQKKSYPLYIDIGHLVNGSLKLESANLPSGCRKNVLLICNFKISIK